MRWQRMWHVWEREEVHTGNFTFTNPFFIIQLLHP